jgi:hypothetical protein
MKENAGVRNRDGGCTTVAGSAQLALRLERLQLTRVADVHRPSQGDYDPVGNGGTGVGRGDRTVKFDGRVGLPDLRQGGRRGDAERPAPGERVERAKRIDDGPVSLGYQGPACPSFKAAPRILA